MRSASSGRGHQQPGKSILESEGVAVSPNGAIAGGAPVLDRPPLPAPDATHPGRAQAQRRGRDDYAASVGVTTHLDQGAFQATNTAADGAAHEDNFTMHSPSSTCTGRATASCGCASTSCTWSPIRRRPSCGQRLKNAFPFLGDDMVKTGGIGEFIAQGTERHQPVRRRRPKRRSGRLARGGPFAGPPPDAQQ